MITLGEAIDYIQNLAIDNPSLLDAPLEDFVIEDENGVEFVITLEAAE